MYSTLNPVFGVWDLCET